MNTERTEQLMKIIDTETAALWDLYRKLGGEYKYMVDQLNDMITLGKRAKAVLDLRNARTTLDQADNETN